MYYVYFLKSVKNEKIYTGFTEKAPQERLKEHNNGANKWTRENKPFQLMYYEKYFCKADAVNRESFYKSGLGRKIRDAIISVMDV